MLFDFIEGEFVFDNNGNISYGIGKKCKYGEIIYVLLVNTYNELKDFIEVNITKEKYDFYKKIIQKK